MTAFSVLVGDIGGTHVRFAVARFSGHWAITDKRDFLPENETFHELLRRYLRQLGRPRPSAISMAVAGPVVGHAATFTNRQWRLSETELLAHGFSTALVVNDFAALAYAAGHLAADQTFTLGPELEGVTGLPISVIGAGTGFGAAALIFTAGASVPVACEAGHMGFAPSNAQEDDILALLRQRFGRVSVERLLSGPGLENLFLALQQLRGIAPEGLDAPAIMQRAEMGDPLCGEVRALFCGIYGSVAGDLALAHGAQGGVFLAGGIAQRLPTVLAGSAFRKRFEDKGRLSYYVKPIPTRIITDPDAALLGAGLAIQPNWQDPP